MFRSCGIHLLALLSVITLQGASAAVFNAARVPAKHAASFLRKTNSSSFSSKMTDEQKKAVVDRHNSLRSTWDKTYQPCTAADMEAMVWDDELAAEAQAYADGCVGDHADGAGSQFGENLFMSYPHTTYTTEELAGGVDDWYSEISDSVWHLTDKKGSCKAGTTVGHYWQVIWARSNRVGCGVASCSHSLMISGGDYGSGVLMVCRYDPPASLKGSGDTNSMPYIFGKPCAACADHCSNGLCTAAPTRCLDKLGGDNTITIGSTKFDNCKKLVQRYPAGSSMPWCTQLAQMMKAEETCALSCGKCTVPEGVGIEHCEGYDPAVHGAPSQEEDAGKAAEESKSPGTSGSKTPSAGTTKSGGQESGTSGSTKDDAKAKMREQMRADMKSKMKNKDQMTSSDMNTDGHSGKLEGSGSNDGWSDSHSGGGGSNDGWGDWQSGGESNGELEGNWDEMEGGGWGDGELEGGWGDWGGGGDGELEGSWDDWHGGGDNWDDDWHSSGDWNNQEALTNTFSRQQMVAEVSAFRPPEMPEREALPAPTPAPVKMSKWQIWSKMP